MNAAGRNKPETVALLMQRGADLTIKNTNRKTVFDLAAHDDVTKALKRKCDTSFGLSSHKWDLQKAKPTSLSPSTNSSAFSFKRINKPTMTQTLRLPNGPKVEGRERKG